MQLNTVQLNAVEHSFRPSPVDNKTYNIKVINSTQSLSEIRKAMKILWHIIGQYDTL
jgi:hypothetical protein